MDNAHTHTEAPSCDSASSDCGSGSKKMDLQSFAAGFLLAAAFFLAPMLGATQLPASLAEVQVSDVDNDGIPDYIDAGLGPVEVEEVEEVCEATDENEDGVVDEGEGCPEVEEEEATDDEASDEEAEAEEEAVDETQV